MSKLLRTAVGPLVLLAASASAALSQTSTARVVVRVTADGLPIAGATVASGTANSATDRLGLATFTLPTGRRTFRVSSSGFFADSLAMNVATGITTVNVALRHESAAPASRDPGERAVAMRDVRRGADKATNVEATDRFSMDEQVERSPGSVSELLNHVDGVRVQPLSAGSAGAGVRIRGMPGHYTKILADGLPLYGASTEGL
ncbi:MAG TPA: TonB-dependent receptor plug domain-containing protein, partial [Gemmatimonadaceae bacterium]|nr:TonB-dependent receptor plug domain-containing protein [Gemmatimonadaceae bacterium]